MTSPYYHAVSSVRSFGGVTDDYQGIHCWLDRHKEHFPDYRHRALTHHEEGAGWCEAKFGSILQNADDREVPVREIVRQHVREDCTHVPIIEDWLSLIEERQWMVSGRKDKGGNIVNCATSQASALAQRFGGRPSDYDDISAWFYATENVFDDYRHKMFRFHAQGIYACERKFGVKVTNSADKTIPTRYIGEAICVFEFNGVPTIQDWLCCMKRKRWMAKGSLHNRIHETQ